MFNMSEPISNDIIIGSIVFIFGLVAIGLLAVEFYKKRGKN